MDDTGMQQLKLLFDYTKFHIGLYTTVATLFAAAVASDRVPLSFERHLLLGAVVFICIAGFAGGVVASSIPQFSSLDRFWTHKTGPFVWQDCLEGRYWTYIEHASFWVAVVLAALSVGVKVDWCR